MRSFEKSNITLYHLISYANIIIILYIASLYIVKNY
nr:MAG TPA: hypothetical protein [Caudoviricetes sp.]